MEFFLETTGTIESGHGFAHFSPVHLGWLAVFLVAAVVGSLLYRRLTPSRRKIARFILAGLIVADELFKMVCLFIGGNYTLNYLPLHLCSINILLIAWHVFKPSKTLDNFLYAVCIPAALIALIVPSWTKLPFGNFMHMHSFTVHILLALYPILLTVGGDIRPDPKKIPKCFLFLFCAAALVYGINLLLDTNFMFLMEADKGNPLWYFEQWFGNHLIGIPVFLIPIFIVMYLPWFIADKISRKKKAQ